MDRQVVMEVLGVTIIGSLVVVDTMAAAVTEIMIEIDQGTVGDTEGVGDKVHSIGNGIVVAVVLVGTIVVVVVVATGGGIVVAGGIINVIGGDRERGGNWWVGVSFVEERCLVPFVLPNTSSRAFLLLLNQALRVQ